MSIWDRIGKALAVVGKGAGQAALWASTHPEVVAEVASISGHPAVAAVIAAAIPKQ
jgi:hypothetical protein